MLPSEGWPTVPLLAGLDLSLRCPDGTAWLLGAHTFDQSCDLRCCSPTSLMETASKWAPSSQIANAANSVTVLTWPAGEGHPSPRGSFAQAAGIAGFSLCPCECQGHPLPWAGAEPGSPPRWAGQEAIEVRKSPLPPGQEPLLNGKHVKGEGLSALGTVPRGRQVPITSTAIACRRSAVHPHEVSGQRVSAAFPTRGWPPRPLQVPSSHEPTHPCTAVQLPWVSTLRWLGDLLRTQPTELTSL